jgi:hypothetical protein
MGVEATTSRVTKFPDYRKRDTCRSRRYQASLSARSRTSMHGKTVPRTGFLEKERLRIICLSLDCSKYIVSYVLLK